MSSAGARLSPRRVSLRSWLLLAVVIAFALGLVAGLMYAIYTAIAGGSHRAPSSKAAASSPKPATATQDTQPREAEEAAEELLAERPMLSLPAVAARPQPMVNATAGPPLALPKPTRRDQLVPTGFPHSAVGALAQLAEIDQAAWLDSTPEQLTRVYSWAALPGAVPLEQWTPYVGVMSLLNNAGQPIDASTLQTSFTPTHGQIKGVLDDGDFVVACVLGEFDATAQKTGKAGVGDCQRMVWTSQGWRIGPGDQPAYAPSAWPGSADSVRAGWRPIQHA